MMNTSLLMTLYSIGVQMSRAPEFIRVKRCREEDSVQALLIDEGQKKRKKGEFIFKLAKTVSSDNYENMNGTWTPLLKLAANDNRHFILEHEGKRRRDYDDTGDALLPTDSTKAPSGKDNQRDTDDLPPEISRMVSKILKLNDSGGDEQHRPRKPSKKHFGSNNCEVLSLPSLNYVYDIYHLENMKDDDLDSYEEGNLGFVKIVNKFVDLVPDEDTDSDQHYDDEDSNEENYYQNDYPEDEDDDRSILLGSEEDEESMPQEITWGNQSEDDFTSLFNRLGESDNILDSLNTKDIVALDSANDDSDDEDQHESLNGEFEDDNYDRSRYETNEFFPSDKEDPLAVHRDKVFGRLEKLLSRS